MVRIYLTKSWSVAESDSEFLVVEGATVSLYEDDIFLDYLTFDEDAYVIDYYPVSGVEVQASGYPTVTASDTMPQAVSAAACYKQQDWYDYNTMSVQTTITDRNEEKNRYWLGLRSV